MPKKESAFVVGVLLPLLPPSSPSSSASSFFLPSPSASSFSFCFFALRSLLSKQQAGRASNDDKQHPHAQENQKGKGPDEAA